MKNDTIKLGQHDVNSVRAIDRLTHRLRSFAKVASKFSQGKQCAAIIRILTPM